MTRGPRQVAIAIAAAAMSVGSSAQADEAPPAASGAPAAAPTAAAPKAASPKAAAAAAPSARTPSTPPPVEEKFGEPEPDVAEAERRSGFMVGTSFGIGPGASNGYPNDPKKIGRSDFYTESGVGIGTYGAIWLGGALADAFSFGIGFGGGGITAGDTASPAGGIMFHVDAYPLFPLGKRWRDVGIALEGGTGGAMTTDAEDEKIIFIDGAGAGYVSAAAFFEAFELWKLRSGPFLGGHYMFSETVRRPLLLAGFRTVLYTGP